MSSKGPALGIELVPSTMWGKNVRKVVSQENWELLREIYGASEFVLDPECSPARCIEDYRQPICKVCSAADSEGSLDLHEVWQFDDERLIQKLVDLIPVCQKCHLAVHLGRAAQLGLYERAVEHLAKINQWSRSDIDRYTKKAVDTWLRRSENAYQLDVSLLEEWIPPSGIHLHWLKTRPLRVYSRIDAIAWAQHMLENDVVILDTETTGLRNKSNVEIIELAIVSIKGKVLFNRRFKPKYRIPKRVIGIHGITNELVANEPSFPNHHREISEILKGKVVVAYNADFDRELLRRTCDMWKHASIDCSWECAMKVFRAYSKAPKWQKLPGVTHSALGDCKAVLRLLRAMAKGN